jgi:DUF917 family protein
MTSLTGSATAARRRPAIRRPSGIELRTLHAIELEDIARGAAVLGTGGGGDPYLGTLAALCSLEQFGPPTVIEVDELADDALVALPFLIGSPVPFIEKFPLGQELIDAFQGLDRFLPGTLSAVMPAEIGGANSVVPLVVGSRLGIPIVDADCMGRAYPEVQLVTLTLHGIDATPLALADEHGNQVVLSTVDNASAERLARTVVVEFGAICTAMAYAVTGGQVKAAAIAGSITYAQRIGAALREAVSIKRDPIAAVAEQTNGVILFRGKIADVQRRTQRGWALGEAMLLGLDEDLGSELTVRFQNENLVAIRDGGVVATVPDLIAILDADTGQAITTERLRYGHRAVVLGIPCDPVWRTTAGIELGGPRHFGYDLEYLPVESGFTARLR